MNENQDITTVNELVVAFVKEVVDYGGCQDGTEAVLNCLSFPASVFTARGDVNLARSILRTNLDTQANVVDGLSQEGIDRLMARLGQEPLLPPVTVEFPHRLFVALREAVGAERVDWGGPQVGRQVYDILCRAA